MEGLIFGILRYFPVTFIMLQVILLKDTELIKIVCTISSRKGRA